MHELIPAYCLSRFQLFRCNIVLLLNNFFVLIEIHQKVIQKMGWKILHGRASNRQTFCYFRILDSLSLLYSTGITDLCCGTHIGGTCEGYLPCGTCHLRHTSWMYLLTDESCYYPPLVPSHYQFFCILQWSAMEHSFPVIIMTKHLTVGWLTSWTYINALNRFGTLDSKHAWNCIDLLYVGNFQVHVLSWRTVVLGSIIITSSK